MCTNRAGSALYTKSWYILAHGLIISKKNTRYVTKNLRLFYVDCFSLLYCFFKVSFIFDYAHLRKNFQGRGDDDLLSLQSAVPSPAARARTSLSGSCLERVDTGQCGQCRTLSDPWSEQSLFVRMSLGWAGHTPDPSPHHTPQLLRR